MLWELVCGRRFLSGEASEHMALVGKGERELPPISDCEDAPPGLDVVIKRLTSFDKAEGVRPRSRAAAVKPPVSTVRTKALISAARSIG